MATVLLCDDEPRFRTMLERVLQDEGHRVTSIADGREAIACLASSPFDVVITDIRMPGVDGFEVIGAARRSTGPPAVIAITGYASIDDTVRAIRCGATDYLAKPFPIERFLEVLASATRERVPTPPRPTSLEVPEETPRRTPRAAPVGELVGESDAMRQVYARLLRFAPTDATVLIQGETGTGKELAAAALHDLSARKRGQLVRVNCANIERSLFESALFGHVRGSFTGAHADKEGLFHAARGGTIFLDEVGEIPLDMQAKLLRAIERKEFLRVGGTAPEKVDVRIIAASNRDLEAAARRGAFREDLWFRLSGFVIVMPPLRERKDDVARLCEHLLGRQAREQGKPSPTIAPDALARLLAYDWPGNVRELENALRSIVTISAGPTIEVQDLPPRIAALPPASVPLAPATLDYHEAKRRVLEQFERSYFRDVVAHSSSISEAARRTGLDRKSLREKVKKLGLALPGAEKEPEDGSAETPPPA
jgi:two-component system response regulator AtoC